MSDQDKAESYRLPGASHRVFYNPTRYQAWRDAADWIDARPGTHVFSLTGGSFSVILVYRKPQKRRLAQ